MNSAFRKLVSGQMRETIGPGADEDPVEHHLSVIGQKTGSLFATAARYGGMCSGATPEHIAALLDDDVDWAIFVFPTWVLLVSVSILREDLRSPRDGPAETSPLP